jgi:hypothetical protein
MAVVISLLIIFVLVIVLVVRRSNSFSLRHNTQFWLIAAYILLLLASPALIKLLPVENLADEKMKTVSGKDIAEAMFSERDLYELAIEGRPEQVKGAFVLEQWEFPLNSSLINVAEGSEYEGVTTIIAEKKDSADGKIEVINYATKTIIDQFDYIIFDIDAAKTFFRPGWWHGGGMGTFRLPHKKSGMSHLLTQKFGYPVPCKQIIISSF